MNNPTITHAYIITGGDATGRHERAKALGEEIAKQSSLPPASVAFSYIRPQRSISLQSITALLQDLSMTAFGGEYRIILIEDAEQLTSEAGNALLKTLEEPANNIIFMLLTSTVARLMPTLRSRSQVISLKTSPISIDLESRCAGFFEQSISQRLVRVAELVDRAEQLEFAQELLRYSQSRRNYPFASWLQDKLVKSQKSGNLRLLLETGAFVAGDYHA